MINCFRMEVHKLDANIIAKIRSSSTINSITQCTTELVLNSLDAKSTAIAIRINCVSFRIQVVDNGDGITKDNLKLIGERYMTSKYSNLDQLETQLTHYGFRGEALASIVNISKIVEITSKHKSSPKTCSKSFRKNTGGDVISVKDRPSCGTTVTVEGFLYNFPLRKKYVVPEMELVYIKSNIESLIIMYPNVSFSLRNDVTGDLILNSRKCKDIISSFKSVHPEINHEYSLIKVSKDSVTVKGLLFNEMHGNNYLQYIYVNKRPVRCSRIQMFIYNLFQRSKKIAKENAYQVFLIEKNKHPAYVLNIKCPFSFVDILLSPAKTLVEFKNWDIILSCIEKLILSFLGYKKKPLKENYVNTCKALKSECGVSQINGVFKTYGFKQNNLKDKKVISRKTKNFINTQNDKMKKLIEGSKFSECSNVFGDNVFCKSRKIIITNENQYSKQTQNKKYAQDTTHSFKNTNNITESSRTEGKLDIANVGKEEIKQNVEKCIDVRNNFMKFIDSMPVKHVLNKKLHPLPITILGKKCNTLRNHNSKKADISNCSEISKSHKIEKINHFTYNALVSRDLNIHKPPDEKSLLSKCINDENKGKNLIMDMFLKSTQVYNSGEDQSDKSSEDTVLEVESNYFLKNNITTNINGKSKTMSVSVNIRKKFKKKYKVYKKHTSKAIQTSLDMKNIISKSVQTSMHERHMSNNINYNNLPNDTKLAENCTIIFSTTDRNVPQFKFVYRSPCNLFNTEQKIPANESNLNNCKCNCHAKFDKIFKFDNSKFNEIPKISTKNYPNQSTTKNNLTGNNSSYYNFYNNYASPIQTIQCKNQNNLEYIKNFSKPEIDFVKQKEMENILENCELGVNILSGNENHFKEVYPTSVSEFFLNGRRSPYFFKSHSGPPSTLIFNISDRVCEKESNHNSYVNFDPENIFPNIMPSVAQRHTYFNPQFNSTQVNHLYDKNYRSPNKLKRLNSVSSNWFAIPKYDKKRKHNKYLKRNDSRRECNITYSVFPKKTDQCNVSTLSNVTNSNNTNEMVQSLHNCIGNHLNILQSRHISPEYNISEKFNMIGNYAQNDTILSIGKEICNPTQAAACVYQTNKTTSDLGEHTKLFITLSNQQKQDILKNEMDIERRFCNQMCLGWESQMVVEKKEDINQQEIEEPGQEWIKKQNNFGSSFYINKTTGFTTFCTPKATNLNEFKFYKRYEFMPKGLSPILKEIKDIDKSLSQNKKDKLENYIIETHQNELLIMKWQNYIKNNDPKTFFQEIYKEKLNLLDTCIPSALHCKKYFSELKNPVSFNKALFDNITIIGQLDKKFIVVLEKTKLLIVLFDQHAVHERIRLEELIKGYANAKVPLHGDRFRIFLPYNDIFLLKKNETYLNSLGFHLLFFEDGIDIVEIPLCIYKKFKDCECQNSLHTEIKSLIKEIIATIKETGGVTFKNTPKMIQNIINLEACRGAIKFGDNLTNNDCEQLLKTLSFCNLPFQCAHGRPTLIPLLTINLTNPVVSNFVNFKKLL